MISDKVLLIIMDGWGHGPKDEEVNAILKAKTPYVDSLYTRYPNTELQTSGEQVGLPAGQMGNSEVGHLNIGAGRIVYQQLLRINNAFEDGSASNMPAFQDIIKKLASGNGRIHLIGLMSDGGVHAHIDHIKSAISLLAPHAKACYVHGFTDGRDTDPKSGKAHIADLIAHCEKNEAAVASICGRYFAMDRDKKWDRIALAYQAMVHGKGEKSTDLVSSIAKSYEEGTTDEFLQPIVNESVIDGGLIRDGDIVLNMNFRTDRGRQLSMALSQQDFQEQNMRKLDIDYYTLTEYDETFEDVKVVFKTENLINTLGEVIARNNKSQLRIAETEKYPHVTFFFSGGREELFEKEARILCQSPRVATYDLAPEMSAAEISEEVQKSMEEDQPDLIVLNFANADMVGHTGNFEAVVKAVECVDRCTSEVVEEAVQQGYHCLVTADHGNADFEVNPDGSPNTAHTTNPVPLFSINPNGPGHIISPGKLGDLAPTILHIMGLEIPKEMTGEVLIELS